MQGEEVRAGETAFFMASGMYRVAESSGVFFLDPVRILGKSYARYIPRRSAYYSRSLPPPARGSGDGIDAENQIDDPSGSSNCKRKRKKKTKKVKDLNEREMAAELRHQEARPFLLRAHECFLRSPELLSLLPSLTRDDDESPPFKTEAPPCDFIALGRGWRAPHWEISLRFPSENDQSSSDQSTARIVTKVFENPVANDTDDDLEAEFLDNRYILPSRSFFHMSDLRRIRDLIPAHSDHGFNLIVIDPPWENASANQKSSYPTLSSRHFLYLPVRQLAHSRGALVALWVTNKEKLRTFVERELLPSWGVTAFSLIYWLKVKDDGSLIGDLDLFHHRPYECLVLAYVNANEKVNAGSDVSGKLPESNQVIISVPGAYSRKPPLRGLLAGYVAKPGRSLELFSREMHSGWTSWGNESLRFQDATYFHKLS